MGVWVNFVLAAAHCSSFPFLKIRSVLHDTIHLDIILFVVEAGFVPITSALLREDNGGRCLGAQRGRPNQGRQTRVRLG